MTPSRAALVGGLPSVKHANYIAIHGIQHVFHPPVLLNGWPDDDRRSRIVFITRGLEREEVEESWRQLCAASQDTEENPHRDHRRHAAD